MNWELFIQFFNLALGLLLIVRLFSIRLHRIYRWFCGFLIADLSVSATWILYRPLTVISYRFYWFAWLSITPVVWLFTLLTIYFLLERILIQLPGLLRLSKWVLYMVFLAALSIGLVSAWYEYLGPGFTFFKSSISSFVQSPFLVQCWMVEVVLDRVVASASLLSLVGIMVFLLWFPIAIPRNLVVFSIGFTAYFAAMTILLLLRSLQPDETLRKAQDMARIVSLIIGAISGACFGFWSMYLSSAGESVASRIAIQRLPKEQEQLIARLELINEALVKSAHR